MIVLTCAHNIYDRTEKTDGTDLKFTPAMNGKKGRKPVKVKKYYYPEEYRASGEKEYDFAVLELEEKLDNTYGYMGIDMRNNNDEGVEEM